MRNRPRAMLAASLMALGLVLGGGAAGSAKASCGNGVLDAGETCDDGNTSDNDSCPADCVIDACTPDPERTVSVTISFAAPYSVLVAGMSLLVDYPEGKVTVPESGRIPPERFVPEPREGRVLIAAFDLDHAARLVAASDREIAPGALARLDFTGCRGEEPPAAGDFTCSVIEASDPHQNARDGVTCSVALR